MILQGSSRDLDEDESKQHEDQWQDELGDNGHVESERVIEPLEEHGQELLEPEHWTNVSEYFI